MVMHGRTWPCVAIHGQAWQYTAQVAIYGYAWPYMAIHGHAWPCMAMHGHAWPYMAVHGHARLYMAIMAISTKMAISLKMAISTKMAIHVHAWPGRRNRFRCTRFIGRFRSSARLRRYSAQLHTHVTRPPYAVVLSSDFASQFPPRHFEASRLISDIWPHPVCNN